MSEWRLDLSLGAIIEPHQLRAWLSLYQIMPSFCNLIQIVFPNRFMNETNYRLLMVDICAASASTRSSNGSVHWINNNTSTYPNPDLSVSLWYFINPQWWIPVSDCWWGGDGYPPIWEISLVSFYGLDLCEIASIVKIFNLEKLILETELGWNDWLLMYQWIRSSLEMLHRCYLHTVITMIYYTGSCILLGTAIPMVR